MSKPSLLQACFHSVKELSKFALFGVLGEAGRLLPRKTVPVLTYHSIDHLNSTFSISPEAFRQQMQSLKKRGFASIVLSDLVDALRTTRELHPNSFVLTFDDGFRSVYRVAYPELMDLGFVATVFPVTGYLGTTCGWETGEHDRRVGADRLELMTWQEVQEMSRHGFEFGSHGVKHLRLTTVSDRDARDELGRSKAELEDRLGVPCSVFCYPYGDYNPSVQDVVRETGFEGAVTLRFGRNQATTDLYALRRIGSARFTNPQVFKACVYGTYGWHLPQQQGHPDA